MVRSKLRGSTLIRLGTSLALASTLSASPLRASASVVGAGDERSPDARTEGVEAQARVAGTGGQGLTVREGPGLGFAALGVFAEGTVVRVWDGPRFDREGRAWYRVSSVDGRAIDGWSAGEFLALSSGPAPVTIVQSFHVQPPASGRRIAPARVSAYSYQTPGNGAHGSITRSGTAARWGTAAVDPRVIPLGSRLMIEGFDTIFVAEDTGGAVIGDRIEIFFPDEGAAIQFGVRYLQVIVLNE